MKFFTLNILLSLCLIGFAQKSYAQMTVYSGQTATTMAQTLAGAGVTVSNATFVCDTNAYATFAVTPPNISNLGIDSGLVLTSGSAFNNGFNQGVNNASAVITTANPSNNGDADLALLTSNPIRDACILEFDFIPQGDTVKFQYVFGSCEYPSFTCSSFSDIFGFFISGPGITGGFSNNAQNIAIVPGTTSCPVGVNTINCPNSPGCCNTSTNCVGNGAGCTGLTTAQTCNMFVCNAPTNPNSNTVVYPGFTIPLFATALTVPCSTYHLKLAVSDASDQSLDSGVFLKAGSLTSNNVSLSPVSALNFPETYVVEGCSPGGVVVTRPVANPFPLIVTYLVSGTATNGVDYNFLPGSVTIPANQTSAVIPISANQDGIFEGKETVVIRRTSGCSLAVTDSASIAIYDSIQFKIVTPDTTICKFDTVNVVTLGDTNLSIYWNNPFYINNDSILSPIVSPINTVTYYATVNLPGSGCVDVVDSITVGINVAPVVNIGADVALCKNMTYTFTPNITPNNQVYTYQWSPTTYLSSGTVANPVGNFTAEGIFTYTLIVTPTAQGCKGYDTVIVDVLPNDIILNNNDTTICDGASVFMNVTGSTRFAYQWSPNIYLDNDTIQNPVSTPLTDVTYFVTASFPGCPNMVKDISIKLEPNPIVSLGPDREMCRYDTIRLFGDVQPASFSPYTYTWSPTTDLVTIADNEKIFNGSGPTTSYTLSVSTPAGCVGQDNITLTVWPVDFAAVTPAYKGICPGDSILYNVTGPNITGYTWEPSFNLTDATISNPICYPTSSTIYTIYANDIHNCTDTLVAEIFVAQSAVLYAGPDFTLYPGDVYTFNPNTNCTNFTWTPSTYLSATNIANPEVSNASVSQQYIVTGTTDYNCVVRDTVEMTASAVSLINLPNAFNPASKDGKNTFSVDKLGLAKINDFSIYNRWGNKVFQTVDINTGWDGTYLNADQPMGTYIYTIDAVTSDGKKFIKTGNVTLIR